MGKRLMAGLTIIDGAKMDNSLAFIAQTVAASLDRIQEHCRETGQSIADVTPADILADTRTLDGDPVFAGILDGLRKAWADGA